MKADASRGHDIWAVTTALWVEMARHSYGSRVDWTPTDALRLMLLYLGEVNDVDASGREVAEAKRAEQFDS